MIPDLSGAIVPSYTYIDTAQLWLWVVMPGCRLVVDRAVPIPMPVIVPKGAM